MTTTFNYQKVGETNFKQFVKIIKQLFLDEKKTYDLVIGTGNTGLALVKITELILQELNIEMPPMLALPILRFKDTTEDELFNNDILLDEVRAQLQKIKIIKRILFVDDEIYKGISLKTALELLMKVKRTERIHATVVAEDQGFKGIYDMQNIEIEFIPFAHEIEGHNNVIFYMIPTEFDKPIKEAFPENILKWYIRINVLLGLPIKAVVDGKPQYTYTFNNEAEQKIINFKKLQGDFLLHLQNLIRKSLD